MRCARFLAANPRRRGETVVGNGTEVLVGTPHANALAAAKDRGGGVNQIGNDHPHAAGPVAGW
eukprot:466132-Lingulodinium_polyedra.AAC.1